MPPLLVPNSLYVNHTCLACNSVHTFGTQYQRNIQAAWWLDWECVVSDRNRSWLSLQPFYYLSSRNPQNTNLALSIRHVCTYITAHEGNLLKLFSKNTPWVEIKPYDCNCRHLSYYYSQTWLMPTPLGQTIKLITFTRWSY